jgi:hypothetical protein
MMVGKQQLQQQQGLGRLQPAPDAALVQPQQGAMVTRIARGRESARENVTASVKGPTRIVTASVSGTGNGNGLTEIVTGVGNGRTADMGGRTTDCVIVTRIETGTAKTTAGVDGTGTTGIEADLVAEAGTCLCAVAELSS